MDHRFNTPSGWDGTAFDYGSSKLPTTFYAEKAIELAQIEKCLVGDDTTNVVTLLDIAAGPGVLALPLGEKIVQLKKEGVLQQDRTVQVIASDFSPKMVELIIHNLEKRDPSLKEIVHPRVLDGMALALEDNSVDIGFSNFGIFLFPDRSKGFGELYRVLKPGGVTVVTSWKSPGGPGVNLILGDMMKLHSQQQPQQGPPPSGPPLKMPLGEAQDFEEELKAAGFSDIVVHEGATDWQFTHEAMLMFGRTNPMMQGLRDKVGGVERFVELMKQVLQDKFPGEGGVLATSALIAVARKGQEKKS